jgi:hypothetical protein
MENPDLHEEYDADPQNCAEHDQNTASLFNQ